MIDKTPDVASIIPLGWRDALSSESFAAEQGGALTERQLDIIFEARWFRMFLPESLGGPGLGLPEALRLEEALAAIDGSLGWTVTLCSGATMFAGFMEPRSADDLLRDPRACFGGSGAATGTAERQGDHYLINGMWKYATGAPHLTAFTANCRLYEGGLPLTNDAGQPLVRAFVFNKDEVTVHEDWHTMGLCATAGHSFELRDLRVSANRAFDILPNAARLKDPVFQYPFLPFAETTLAVNTSGMALHFLDSCEAIFAEKAFRITAGHAAFLRQRLLDGRSELEQLRTAFYHCADGSWQELCATGQCSSATIADISSTSRNLAWGARRIVQELFPYCGMAATNPGAIINRVWRDLFTASQHSLLNAIP